MTMTIFDEGASDQSMPEVHQAFQPDMDSLQVSQERLTHFKLNLAS